MKKKLYIGIDMGGTTIKGGLVSPSGKILRLESVPTKPRLKKEMIVENVIGVVKKLLNSTSYCSGIGLGWPAAVNIPLEGKTIKRILEKQFPLPVFLDNDANCFTLAEALIGSGKNYSIVVGITLGTGLGGGLVINKKIYHGGGKAPELGHVTLDFQGPKCNCGNFGCFEEYVAKKGITRLAKKHGVVKREGYNLFLLAKEGNKKALLVWREMGKLLGIGLVNTINIFDPELIVLGGKISQAWRFFSKEMKKEIKRRSFIDPCPIKISSLENSGIIGAALLAKQYL